MRKALGQLGLAALQIIPALIFLVAWEAVAAKDSTTTFYFGRPLTIARDLVAGLKDGSLAVNMAITSGEAGLGFILGTALGALAGLALWFSRIAFLVSRPYAVALGATPAFALAPLFIIWFGTGFASKAAIATFSTFVVASVQAYKGVEAADLRYVRAAQALGANRSQTFRKVIVPSALTWIFGAAQLNVGLALLGAFIGEVISSEAGLGHEIVVASGLFDLSRVWAGVLSFVALAIVATAVLDRVQGAALRVIVRRL